MPATRRGAALSSARFALFSADPLREQDGALDRAPARSVSMQTTADQDVGGMSAITEARIIAPALPRKPLFERGL